MNKESKEIAKTLTVELLLALRRELLATGASALGHWDQLQSRLTIASRTSADLSSWFSTMCRQLNLPAVSSVSSKAFRELLECVKEHEREWIKEIEVTVPALIARTRVEAEARRAWRTDNE